MKTIKKDISRTSENKELSTQPEAKLRKQKSTTQPGKTQDHQRLIQEHQVQQCELRIPNEELRKSEEIFRLTFYQAGVGKAQTEHETGRFVCVNPAFCEFTGYTEAELLQKTLFEITFPEDRESSLQLFQSLTLKEINSLEVEKRYVRKDGVIVWALVSLNQVFDNQGQPLFGTVIIQNITKRKRAEEEIQSLAKFPYEEPFPILRIDRNGTLLYLNPAGIKLLPMWRLNIGQTVPSFLLEAVLHSLNNEQERFCTLEHGENIFKFTIVPIVPAGYVNLYGLDITLTRRFMQDLEESRENLHNLTAYWQSAIESERANLAREIHDEFGQTLTALKMDLAWLTKRLPKDDVIGERIHTMNMLIDNSYTRMQQIATNLRPTLLDDLGLSPALEWQANEFSKRSGISISLNLHKDNLSLAPTICTSIFRIFQETLTNVIRHAHATHVDVNLEIEDQTLILAIQDNGRGISESEINDRHSLGLLGLYERATMSGGKLVITGIPGEGTTITVHIPLFASPMNVGKP